MIFQQNCLITPLFLINFVQPTFFLLFPSKSHLKKSEQYGASGILYLRMLWLNYLLVSFCFIYFRIVFCIVKRRFVSLSFILISAPLYYDLKNHIEIV